MTPNDVGELQPLIRHFRSSDDEFAVGLGWRSIVRRCHDAIEAAFPDYELLAVKQKFGELAFQAFPRAWRPSGDWTEAERRYLDDIIAPYVEESSRTCENCGAEGSLREERPEMATLCDTCVPRLG